MHSEHIKLGLNLDLYGPNSIPNNTDVLKDDDLFNMPSSSYGMHNTTTNLTSDLEFSLHFEHKDQVYEDPLYADQHNLSDDIHDDEYHHPPPESTSEFADFADFASFDESNSFNSLGEHSVDSIPSNSDSEQENNAFEDDVFGSSSSDF